MLENLKQVPWKKLSHAYGSAKDVPGLLRGLLSPDPDVREHSLDALQWGVIHQGTRTEAAPHVVPFLYEMLQDSKTPDREKLLDYLVYLAVGYEDEFLPYGFRPTGEWELYEEETWLASVQGIPTLLECTYSSEEEVRKYAVKALTFIWTHGDKQAIERVGEIAFGDGSISERSNAIVALGIMSHQQSHAHWLPGLKGQFIQESGHISPLAAAAASGILLHEEGREELSYLLQLSAETIREDFCDMQVFCQDNTLKYIASVILMAGKRYPNSSGQCLQKLCQFMSFPYEWRYTSVIELVSSINGLDQPKPFNELTPESQEALRLLGDDLFHPDRSYTDGNAGLCLKDCGLPFREQEFLAYIKD